MYHPYQICQEYFFVPLWAGFAAKQMLPVSGVLTARVKKLSSYKHTGKSVFSV
jgi:hypothetical protein